MKKIYSTIIIFFVVLSSLAQTPTYFNFNTNVGSNAFPWATTTSRKIQWRINANSLGAVSIGNNITAVYFMMATGGTSSYPLLNIRLKQGPAQFAAGGNYETGMTLVYSGTNVSVTGTAAGWIMFTLQTPFLYDPNLPLFVEVEHNATSVGGGLNQCQTSPAGPGFGRLYGNYPNLTYAGADQTVAHFGIDVIPATPCTSPPPANSTSPSNLITCPGFANPGLSISSTYSFGGLTYQWYSSTVSAVGLYTAIPGATMNIAPTPTLGVTTWYQVVATCTNPGGGSTTLTPSQYSVQTGNVVNTVPYNEGFEGVQINNRLPNCSWFASNLGTTVNSYTASNSGNRVPRTGNKFAGFSLPSTNNYVYTNGITMSPGITYSAALWYATEYLGGSNWTSLELLVGPNQSTTGLVSIAVVSPAISGAYKKLSGLFTVPSGGDYYVAIKATGASGTALYLSWDDLSVTIPCDGSGANTPTLNVTASTQSVCAGQALSLNAAGADTYTWNTGANTAGLTENPTMPGLTNYTVYGTSLLSGCVSMFTQSVMVMPAPLVAIAIQPNNKVCVGQQFQLSAMGNASSYLWSNGGVLPAINVTVASASSFTLIGTGSNGCTSESSQAVSVYSVPVVTGASSIPGEACKGDVLTLTANGALSYKWISNTSPLTLQGSAVNVSPNGTTVYTITGTDGNGCTAKYTLTQNVNECVGIKENTASLQGLMIYPNPTNGVFTVELKSSALKTIEVMDLTGRVILAATSSDEKTDLNIGILANGVYYVKVKTDNGVNVTKVVKN